ncbi:MAG: ClpXP protease specificity-enhancing factor [Gammaproteobacteria bacterium]|nr:ClpXP protease specificity-enhancing factor [Gammaproteobacteria bacterium]NND54866.1 ClpXP protease specificity-enhancing factor [Gammaproteobacteria bacterium]
MTSTRPYLLRAMHEWMSDNGQTPLLLVDAMQSDVQVPEGFVEDDHIVLNVSWSATRNLQLENELISFEARFSGSPHFVSVPVSAVKGIYARESGQGMMFQDEPVTQKSTAGPRSSDKSSNDPAPDSGPGKKKPGRPGLRIVK